MAIKSSQTLVSEALSEVKTITADEALKLSNEETLKLLLKKCKIDSNIFFNGIADPKIKDELKNITKEAHDKEIFGAPTFVVNNKIFWGQDRLEFALDEYNK